MKKLSVLNFLPLTGLLFAFNTHAAMLSSCAPGDTDAVQLEEITKVGENNNLLSQSYSASTCLIYAGNDDANGGSDTDPNLGYVNDGFLNGKNGFDFLQLISPSDLQDLDGDGNANDPGWIHLASFGENMDNSGNLQLNSYSDVGVAGNTANVSEFLSIAFSCEDSAEANECSAGSWSLELKPGSVIADIQNVLGRPAIFDHLTFTIKAGSGKVKKNGQGNDAATGTAIYDFNFNDIFSIENSPELNFTTPYSFSGTWSTAALGLKGVSHINVWARDPLLSTDVSAPASAFLALLGLLALRRRVSK